MSLNEIENLQGAKDVPDSRDFISEHLLGADVVDLPASVMLNICPSHDQGKTWSCTAYGLTHVVEIENTEEFKPLTALADPDEQWANQKYQAGAVRAARMDGEGDSLQNALNAYIKFGLNNKNTEIHVDKYESTGFVRIKLTLDDFKAKLAQGYPIYTGWKNHCFSVVGYDDNTQMLTAKNSFGPKWGKKRDGTFDIDYSDINKLFTPYIIFDKQDLTMIFKDVSENSPFAEDIKAVRDLGLMSGYGVDSDPLNKFFKPEQPVTRAELAAVINRLYKKLSK